MKIKINNTITITSLVSNFGKISCSPSTAEVTVMAGVIIPSASNVAPPNIAKNTTLFLVLFFINAKSENTPPSPWLSALSAINTYLVVVCRVITQNIKLTNPRINISFSAPSLFLTNDFITYRTDVPISPKIIPIVIITPRKVSFFLSIIPLYPLYKQIKIKIIYIKLSLFSYIIIDLLFLKSRGYFIKFILF